MVIDVHQLSKELSLSESGIYQMVSQREILFVRIGRSIRFDLDDIDKWLVEKKSGYRKDLT